MSDYLERAQRYHKAIQDILLREWDPIGSADNSHAQDEYDAYIHEIYALLIRHISKPQLFEHLWWIETVHMGLYGNRGKTEAIADKLLATRDVIESEKS